jgi:hypothetical protein
MNQISSMLDSLYIYYYMSLVRLKGTDILEKKKRFLFYSCYLKLDHVQIHSKKPMEREM